MVQIPLFRPQIIDDGGLLREPLWAIMVPKWIEGARRGASGDGGGAEGEAVDRAVLEGGGDLDLEMLSVDTVVYMINRTVALDRNLRAADSPFDRSAPKPTLKPARVSRCP